MHKIAPNKIVLIYSSTNIIVSEIIFALKTFFLGNNIKEKKEITNTLIIIKEMINVSFLPSKKPHTIPTINKIFEQTNKRIPCFKLMNKDTPELKNESTFFLFIL